MHLVQGFVFAILTEMIQAKDLYSIAITPPPAALPCQGRNYLSASK